MQIKIKKKLAIFELLIYSQFINLETKGKTMHPQFIASLNVIKESLSNYANPGHVLKDWYARELINQDQYQALLPHYFAVTARSN